MKIRVTFKTPDAASEAIVDAVRESIPQGLSEEETTELYQVRMAQVADVISSFMQYDEYIKVEFDIDAKTATVVGTP